MGRLVFLLRLHGLKKLPLLLVDGGDDGDDDDDVEDAVPFSVVTFPSLSQSSTVPILIAIESLSVDTRLPWTINRDRINKHTNYYPHVKVAFIILIEIAQLVRFIFFYSVCFVLRFKRWDERKHAGDKNEAPVFIACLFALNPMKFFVCFFIGNKMNSLITFDARIHRRSFIIKIQHQHKNKIMLKIITHHRGNFTFTEWEKKINDRIEKVKHEMRRKGKKHTQEKRKETVKYSHNKFKQLFHFVWRNHSGGSRSATQQVHRFAVCFRWFLSTFYRCVCVSLPNHINWSFRFENYEKKNKNAIANLFLCSIRIWPFALVLYIILCINQANAIFHRGKFFRRELFEYKHSFTLN